MRRGETEVSMKPMTLRLVMVAAALGALSLAGPCLADDAAGGPPAPAAIKTSCGHVKSLSICVDYTAEAFAVLGEDFHKGGCTASNGTWAAQPCPTEKAVGTCALGSGKYQRYYNGGNIPYKADGAAKDCTGLNNGKWLGAPKPPAPKK
jgi:hypothetical protein